MLRGTKRNRLFAVGTALLMLVAVKMTPSLLPYTIYTSSLVMPLSEWTLSRAQNGNLISTLKDNRTNNLRAFSASVFQRGYQANFQLNPAIYHRSRISKGDTIATMYSNQDEERLIQLTGDLAIQEAELNVKSSGQKFADISAASNQIALAQQELANQRAMTQRTETLRKDSLVSEQEYQSDINKLRVRELNLKMAEANYESATTGGKPEQIQVVNTRINALQRQIRQIKNNLKDLTLVSPVSGSLIRKKTSPNPTEEILLSIADNSALVLVLPVSYLEKEYVQREQSVEVAITGTSQIASGRIIGIDNTIQLVDGRQAFFVTALIEQSNLPLLPGMLVKTRIYCKSISIKEHLTRLTRPFFVY